MSEGSNQDNEGSVWRRWDPHVHFPGTLHNDNFGALTVAGALDILAERTPSIEAVGVTDYFTTASFRQVQAAWSGGAGQGITFLFPNIELRLSHATRHEAALNLHVLCSPEEVDGLDRFLGTLEFHFQDRVYRCNEGDLRDLGRVYSGDISFSDRRALQIGAEQFKVEFGQLHDAFERDAWAKENLLVAVAGGTNDGTSGLQRPDNAFSGLRQSIERFSHIILSGDPKQSEFWCGRGVLDAEALLERYNGKKLCLHGSDAHSTERLGMPDLDRRCWLKGEPSFETLRMACLAPDTRGHLGATDPMEGYRHGRIARVSVRGKSWFPASGVAINPGLIAIIGARGSGKTALADIIAAGAGSDEPFGNSQSFIRRADTLLRDCASEVHWTHDETTSRDLGSGSVGDPTNPRGVRYLSQQFVEQLCAADGVSDSLLAEIERVVFDSLPPGSRQEAMDFGDLLAIRLQAARSRQRHELESIADVAERITNERLVIRSAPVKREEVKRETTALERLSRQIQDLAGTGNRDNAERLHIVSQALEVRNAQLQAAERRRTDLMGVRSDVASTRSTAFPRILKNIHDEHPHARLSDTEWAAFKPVFAGDVDDVLAKALAAVERLRRSIAGDAPAEPAKVSLDALSADELKRQTVAILTAEQNRLQALVGLDRRRAADLRKLNDQASERRAKLTKLRAEIDDADRAPDRRDALQHDRLEHYAAYFGALLQEEAELRELYAPLANKLSNFGASAAKLNLSVRRKVDVAAWAADGERHFDLRTTGRFKGYGELERIATDELLPAWRTGDGRQAADAIRAFSTAYSPDFVKQGTARSGDQEAYREWERSLSRWLYSAEHITLSYTLMYDGLSIERLSPGLRGIVLLLLYLAVDRTESDPLIIDQPEENLDPESVYSELVTLFREASRRRQIIMVTHNANLVVNTDVDQVIVARCKTFEEGKLPDLRYLSGGLEERDVRTAVCEVLEGGAEAFRQRARRLRLTL